MLLQLCSEPPDGLSLQQVRMSQCAHLQGLFSGVQTLLVLNQKCQILCCLSIMQGEMRSPLGPCISLLTLGRQPSEQFTSCFQCKTHYKSSFGTTGAALK